MRTNCTQKLDGLAAIKLPSPLHFVVRLIVFRPIGCVTGTAEACDHYFSQTNSRVVQNNHQTITICPIRVKMKSPFDNGDTAFTIKETGPIWQIVLASQG